MKEMKFRVHNEEHSKAIQDKLFELGYDWGGENKTSYIEDEFDPKVSVGFLYSYAAGLLGWDEVSHRGFKKDERKETALDELYKLQSIKKLQLNEDHTATILEKERVVKVGRQEFTFEKIKELHKAISTL